MKNTQWILVAAIIMIGLIMVMNFSGQQSEFNYLNFINEERQEKDRYFKYADDSPIAENERQQFQGLDYFPVDESYSVVANLVRFTTEQIVKMPTSDNKEKFYRRYATANFELNGQTLKLTLFQPVDRNEKLLFMPFADETSALSTYGAGRYLDFEVPDGDELIIDFNLAYNPYCAYSEKFSCPFPPRENMLEVAIEAGEKNYSK